MSGVKDILLEESNVVCRVIKSDKQEGKYVVEVPKMNNTHKVVGVLDINKVKHNFVNVKMYVSTELDVDYEKTYSYKLVRDNNGFVDVSALLQSIGETLVGEVYKTISDTIESDELERTLNTFLGKKY